MGTPCACIYAAMFFAWYERQYLLPKYKKHLLLYKRQIDDILGLWINDPTSSLTYNDFIKDLNTVTKLHWECEPLSTSVNFLDLTIYISSSNNILTKTYQK